MGKMNRAKRLWASGGMLIVLLLTGMVAWGQMGAGAGDTVYEGYDPYAVVAEALGLTQVDLEDRLEEIGSIAAVARLLGLDPSTVVTALQTADEEEIDQAIVSGEIDQAEASTWRDESIVFATEFVYLAQEDFLWALEEDWEAFGLWDEFDEADYDDDFGEYGNDVYTPIEGQLAVESQRAMAYSLLDSGMDPYLVLDAVFDAELTLIDQIQDPFFGFWGLDDWAFDEDFGFEDLIDDEFWTGFALEDELGAAVSEVLGIGVEEIWDAVDAGETLAQLAESEGIDPQILVDRLMADEIAWIDELVADGELDGDEAADWREESLEFMRELVFESWF